MRRIAILCCLGMFAACLLSETASAQLFPRVWANRKAQIRAEVYGQVSREMQAGLHSGIEAARSELQAAAEQQVAAESEKLAAQVQSDVVRLQEEVQKLVSQEADKLAKQAAEEIVQMREQAAARVAAEAERLADQTQKQQAELKAENEARLQTTIASLNQAIERALGEATQTLENALPEQVVAEVTRQADKLKGDMLPEIKQAVKTEVEALQKTAALPSAPPANTPDEPQQQAVQVQPVRVVEEEAASDSLDAGA